MGDKLQLKEESKENKYISRFFPEYVRDVVEDPGIDEKIKNLTSEKIEKTINMVLDRLSVRAKASIKTCMHCGLCSDACHHYLSNDRDPTYAPVSKVKMTIWEMLERKGRVSSEFIKQCARIAFTECNMCHRCSLYCPFGIDIANLIGIVRRICFLLGVVPYILMDYEYSLAATLTQLWIPQSDWIDALQWMEEEGASEIENFYIPFNKEGIDVLFVTLGTEPARAPQYIQIIGKIMYYSGTNWSYSLKDYANMSMFVQDYFTMQRIVREVFEEAIKLRAKRIVVTECGHATFALCKAAPPLLGYKDLPFEILHATEFYYELLKTGKLRIKKKIKEPVTLQDPCNLVREKGAGDKLRELMEMMCEDFREMYPNREHNFCCNAGGGIIAAGPLWKKIRVQNNKIKAEQIKETGAKIVIAPCHNCHVGIHDIVHAYGLDVKVKFMWDILLETTEIS